MTTQIGYARVSKTDGRQVHDSQHGTLVIWKPKAKMVELCAQRGIVRRTLYRHVTPRDEIGPDGEKRLACKRTSA